MGEIASGRFRDSLELLGAPLAEGLGGAGREPLRRERWNASGAHRVPLKFLGDPSEGLGRRARASWERTSEGAGVECLRCPYRFLRSTSEIPQRSLGVRARRGWEGLSGRDEGGRASGTLRSPLKVPSRYLRSSLDSLA